MTTAARRPRRTPLRTHTPRTTLRGRTAAARPAAASAPRADRTPPQIPLHEAIRRVMRDMPPVPKQGYNEEDGYYYKRLEDVILKLREVCIVHGLTVLPVQVATNRTGHGPLVAVEVRVTYDITGPDGKSKAVQYAGEARSETDKGTQIAMSQCWKYLMTQVFMIPSEEDAEGDARSPRIPNVRDIRSRADQRDADRAASQRRHPAGRQRPQGQQQDNGQGAPPAPVIAAPNAKAIADRLVRAASAPNADAVIPILEEATKAGAPEPEIQTIREIGRTKRAAEREAAAKTARSAGHTGRGDEHQDHHGQGDEHGAHDHGQGDGEEHGDAGASEPPAIRLVPPVDVPEQSPEAAARVKAVEFFNECAETAGYEHPAEAARMFKARYGRTLEEAEVYEIEAFAAGMIPDGAPSVEDGHGSETDE
ncbi:ERF family protein [Streptomyces violaceusniger]|uniref:ERF family protein n=1 Tax=Streptomyces violaceusniger (strain Tu 4113) TaxID=653045 RepID=G2PHW5_STRV4|nr:ERF family protein [Streptomyces violaceusniger]AEM88916.1 ERF family protein [Streptomyces violaceusniger Tu 4113]